MQLVTFLTVVIFLSTAVSMTFAPINLIASSDGDDKEDEDDTRDTSRDEDNDEDDENNDDTPAHIGERVFDDERRITESAPQSSKAPVEVKTSLEIDDDDRSGDPAHTGKIVFKDEDGDVIKEITQESASQSSKGKGFNKITLEKVLISSFD